MRWTARATGYHSAGRLMSVRSLALAATSSSLADVAAAVPLVGVAKGHRLATLLLATVAGLVPNDSSIAAAAALRTLLAAPDDSAAAEMAAEVAEEAAEEAAAAVTVAAETEGRDTGSCGKSLERFVV